MHRIHTLMIKENQCSDGYHASSLILGMAFMALNYLEVELAPLHILIWIKIRFFLIFEREVGFGGRTTYRDRVLGRGRGGVNPSQVTGEIDDCCGGSTRS